MGKKTIIILVIFFTIILQQSFFVNFFSQGATPNFVLVALVTLSAIYGFEKSWKAVVVAGFLVDIFYFLPVGLSAFSFILATFIAALLAKRFLVTRSLWRIPALLFIVAIGTIVNELAIFLLIKLLAIVRSGSVIEFQFSYNYLFVQLWHNAFGFCLLYWPTKKIKRYFIENNNFRKIKLRYQ